MKAVATVLSNNILVRANRENILVTPMKLQKLLYYICVQYAKSTRETPISEAFEVWQYGPVLPSVYSEFKPFGANPIKKMAQNATGKSLMVDESANPILRGCIDDIWRKYKHMTGIELSKMTHRCGSGWYAAYQSNREVISVEDMINDTTA